MKQIIAFTLCLFITVACFAQQPLPTKTYATMRDSTTSVDVVLYKSTSGSLSLEGRNVQVFNNFFENRTATKGNQQQAGIIMWQINGREFLSGNLFLGDSTGFVVTTKDGKEYINRISPQGNSFIKNQIKK